MKYLMSIFIILTCFAFTCEKQDENCFVGSHNGLTIKNTSSRTINYEFYWNYPDTLITDSRSPISDKPIDPGMSMVRGAGPGSCWESVFLSSPDQKQWIYFFDRDSLEQIPWDVVRQTNRGILERRLLSLDSLKKSDFTVIYR